MRFIVYGLRDPRTMEIRYVGKSTWGLERPRRHGGAGALAHRSHKSSWILSLHRRGLNYQIVILARFDSPSGLDDAERYWISVGRAAIGHRFTNVLDGGEGAKHTPETRAKIARANRGHSCSSETRSKIGNANRGRRWTHKAETKAKLSAAKLGRKRGPMSDEQRVKISNAMRGQRRESSEYRARLSAALMGHPVSIEARAKMSFSKSLLHLCRLLEVA